MLVETISPGNSKTEDVHRREICTAGRWLHERHFAPATDGNISVRLNGSAILTTPTCLSKGMMTAEDLVVTDMQGRPLCGTRSPSTELAMHLSIYRVRPDIFAICHAHPPIATGYAAAGLALDKPILSEAVLSLRCIPLAPYGTPGTTEVCDSIEPLLRQYEAILLANHGVVTYGPDLLTAFFRMETVEHVALVSLVTQLLGKQSILSAADVEKLLAARSRHLGRPHESEAAPAANSRDNEIAGAKSGRPR
ncbi:MAG TPA: class II aldolase/adducin family protein [Candidatus Acidoferrales bacterium]|jgi:L-fuculose-phosphate aldolase|nr:class II aldolase/adducin family protein [Candidatus Acidoferrales bacterium]